MKRADFNQYLAEKQFIFLFNELGWDRGGSQLNTTVSVDDLEFEFEAVAQKRGFLIYTCVVDEIPQNSTCKKIDIRLRRYSNDYIVIFHKPHSEHHMWIAPVKTVEKRDLVTLEYASPAQADFLFSKLNEISFDIQEEVTIVDVTTKVHKAFEVNSTQITKSFYVGFKQQHKSFANFINGIDIEGDKQWYASVMLNRLMFCYFIQKKGFLNFDKHYLRNKLEWTQEQRGQNKFFSSFYKGFLRILFHGGLNNPVHGKDFEQVYGRIPYLNGGMFDEHQLEMQYAGIDIDDKAFEELFEFFDKWRWHLDTRITATGKDINPDVLGYIFEQYINDRAQMGAYYTKEDITEYISKNCIIPFLMDEVAKTSSGKHFAANGFVWQTLKNSDDKYIYNAIKKGVKEPLPDYIEIGIDTTKPNLLERRARWNEPASEKHALPTEIWRETVERRKRHFELMQKIAGGEITHINDFITYNLDIRTFVQDLLENTTDHLLILHFYKALRNVTILDPTCGSGAFLFAALNILEPLYEICIARMEEFQAQNPHVFKDELAEISNKYRSNIQYFIYKSIILRNLYGVDIMAEATEIAKLRLFLKMVAVVDVNPRAENLGLDPLPDIDFNIRCGNTLVGYATEAELEQDLTYGDMFAKLEFKELVEEGMEKVALTYQRFKDIQLNQHADMESFKQAKTELNNRLKELNNTLNRRLHSTQSALKYEDWRVSHQPFHWLAEYYQIIKGNGGFDVIIGNPPYLEVRQIKYKPNNLKTLDSGAIHCMCIERSLHILNKNGNISMIVPLALVCTQRMTFTQTILEESRTTWYSNFAWRPGKLFDNVNRALTIFTSNYAENPTAYSTKYIKWSSDTRSNLFPNISFTNWNSKRDAFWFPKLGNSIEKDLLLKVLVSKTSISHIISKSATNQKIYYRTTGGLYWKIFTNFSPKFFLNGKEGKSSRETYFSVTGKKYDLICIALLSSNLYWWWYTITSNLRDLNPADIQGFRFPETIFNDNSIIKLANEYLIDLEKNSELLTRIQQQTGETQTQSFKISLSKPIIDEIDKVLAQHYGFTDEELDFIINYDIKYRMGKELEGEES